MQQIYNEQNMKQDFYVVDEAPPWGQLSLIGVSNATIHNAKFQSAMGYFRFAADICSNLLEDEKIYGSLEQRCSELPGSAVSFEGVSNKPIKALMNKEDFWTILPEATFKQVYQYTLLMGFAICQLVWKQTDDGRELPVCNFIHPRNVRTDIKTNKWYLQLADYSEIEMEFGNGKYAMFSTAGKHSHLNPLWLRLSKLYMSKLNALNAWIYHLVHFGNSISVFSQLPDSAEGSKSASDVAKLCDKLTNADARIAMVLPKGYSLDLLEPDKSNFEGFAKNIEMSNQGIEVAILGSNISTASETGFGGQGLINRVTNLTRVAADQEIFSTQIRDQIFVPYCYFNWGRKDIAPFISWQIGQDLKETREAAFVQMTSQGYLPLYQAGAITKNELRAKFKLEPIP